MGDRKSAWAKLANPLSPSRRIRRRGHVITTKSEVRTHAWDRKTKYVDTLVFLLDGQPQSPNDARQARMSRKALGLAPGSGAAATWGLARDRVFLAQIAKAEILVSVTVPKLAQRRNRTAAKAEQLRVDAMRDVLHQDSPLSTEGSLELDGSEWLEWRRGEHRVTLRWSSVLPLRVLLERIDPIVKKLPKGDSFVEHPDHRQYGPVPLNEGRSYALACGEKVEFYREDYKGLAITWQARPAQIEPPDREYATPLFGEVSVMMRPERGDKVREMIGRTATPKVVTYGQNFPSLIAPLGE